MLERSGAREREGAQRGRRLGAECGARFPSPALLTSLEPVTEVL